MKSAALSLCLLALLPFAAAAAPSFGFTPAAQPAGIMATDAVIGDFNGDGNPDIASVNGTQLVTVVLGDGQGGFSQPINSKITSNPFNSAGQAIATADMNGDGRADLVVYTAYAGAYPPVPNLVVLLGNGDGTFVAKAGYTAFTQSPAAFGSLGPSPLALADLNGDGRLDLALVDPIAATLDVWLGNGDGTLQGLTSYPTGFSSGSFVASSVAVADFNGDGILDAATAVGVNLAVLFGNGDGTFQPGISVNVPSRLALGGGLIARDFNGDGHIDLATTDGDQIGVRIRLNNGNGTFQPGSVYGVPNANASLPIDMRAADVTGDGIPDIVTSLAAGPIVVFPGNPDGTFQPAAVYPGQTHPASLAIGDLNGDGRPDLVMGSTGAFPNPLTVLLGTPAPFLRATVTHNGNFLLNQSDAAFTITVSNAAGASTTNGTVTVQDRPGTYYNILGISGTGWTCTLVNATCTRSDALPAGSSYPPITVGIQILVSYPTNDPATNAALLSGGGSMSTQATDTAIVLPYTDSCFFALNAPQAVSFGAAGGELDYTSLPLSGACPVQTQPTVSWITLNGDAILIAPNTTGASRSGAINFTSPTGWTGQITVNQSGATDCTPEFWPNSTEIGAAGGTNLAVRMILTTGCTWTATSNVAWMQGSSGDWTRPLMSFTASGNPGLADRSGTLTVNGTSFTVFQAGSATLAPAGSLAHLAVGGAVDSSILLVNTANSLARTSLSFFGDNGTALVLPVAVSGEANQTSSGYFQTLVPNSIVEIDSSGAGSLVTQTGSAMLSAEPGVSGFIRFHYDYTGQEALVPLETRNASAYVLPFDNTEGLATGVALANLQAQAVTVNAIVRDDTGSQIGTGLINLPAQGHTSFVLSNSFSQTANLRGTIEMDSPAAGQISALGIRFRPPGTLTTIPVLTQVAAGSGSMAHFASGAGWVTSLTLVNTGTVAATAHLRFFDDSGAPASLPFTISQPVSTATASALDRTLPANSMMVIETGASSSTLQTGSVQLAVDGSISGFIMFRWVPSNQEAVVPLETRNAGAYVLAFDNTNGVATGVAIANVQSAAGNVPVVIRDDTGAQIGTGTIDLAADGHTAFVLATQFPVTANRRGTIEFDTPANGQISALGLRYTAAGAFSSIPALAK